MNTFKVESKIILYYSIGFAKLTLELWRQINISRKEIQNLFNFLRDCLEEVS